MGLKESGLRGSLRNVSVGIDAIPDPEDWQSYDIGVFPEDYTDDLGEGSIVSDTYAIEGDRSFRLTTTSEDNPGFTTVASRNFDSERKQENLKVHYYEEEDGSGGAVRWFDSSDQPIVAVGTGNPEAQVYNGDFIMVESSPTPEYGEWRLFEITLDYENNTFDYVWEDITGDSSTISESGLPMENNVNGVGRWEAVVENEQEDASPAMGGVNPTELWLDVVTSF